MQSAESNYPRENRALAPSMLSHYLGIEVPHWLSARCDEFQYLADLDASVWRFVSLAEARSLSVLVSEALEASIQSVVSEMGDTPIWRSCFAPREALAISAETQSVLEALDASLVHGWQSATLAQVVSAAGYDAPTVLDLIVALEYWGVEDTSGRGDSQALADAAGAVSAALSGSGVSNQDPRLGRRIQAVLSAGPRFLRREAIDVAADWIAANAHQVGVVPELEQAMSDLATELAAISQESLEDQLRALAHSTARQARDARIVIGRHGWDGMPPSTLQQVADAEGLTRERIRQVCVRAEKALTDAVLMPYAPAADAALKLLDARSPVSAAEAARLLIEARVLEFPGTSVHVVLDAARLLGRSTELEVREVGHVEWVCRPEDELLNERCLGCIRTRAGRLTDSRGAATVETLRAGLSAKDGVHPTEAQVLDCLPYFDGFEWLDEGQGWFWIRGRNSRRNRFLNLARKALSVAGSLPLSDLRAALRRSRRLKGPLPPDSVLLKMCRGLDGIEVNGESVRANPGLDYGEVLQGTELYLVEMLRQIGSAARAEDMWQIACNDGIGRVSFWVTLHDSPAIVRYAKSTYGLRGVHVPASEVWDVANRRVARTNSVLRDWGRISDGPIWMLFKLSSRAVQNGQMAIPAAIRGQADGEYDVCFRQQAVPGRAVVQGNFIWGLRRLYRLAEVENGDWVLLALDLDARRVYVRVGDEELSMSDESDVVELVEAGCTEEPEAIEPDEADAGEPGLEPEEVETEASPDGAREGPLSSEVLGVLARAYRPLKAREIAHAVALLHGKPVSRSDVNHLLYGDLADEVVSVGDGVWILGGRQS